MARNNVPRKDFIKRWWLPSSIVGVWLLLFVDVSLTILATGLLCAALGTLWMRRVFARAPWLPAAVPTADGERPIGPFRRLLFLALFIPVFLVKILSAGANIAHLALAPSMDFWPGIVKIKGKLPSLDHTALLAYLVTLTPGTLSLDYDEEGDDLYVHWIDVAGYGDADMDDRVTTGLRTWVRRLLG